MKKVFFNMSVFVVFIALFMPLVLKAQPGGAEYKKAEYYRKQKDYANALIFYDKAISKEPGNYRYYFRKGTVQYKMKQLDGAISTFQSAVNAKSSFAGSYLMLGQIYIKKKDYQKAENYFVQAFQHEEQKYKKLKYMSKAIQIAMKRGAYSTALNYATQAKAIDPTSEVINYLEGRIYASQGNWQQARASFEKALDKVKGAPPAQAEKYYFWAGKAANKTGDAKTAKTYFDKLVSSKMKKYAQAELKSTSEKYFFAIGIAYFKVGEYADAKKNIQKAIEKRNDWSKLYKVMALIDFKNGSNSSAIANAQKAIQVEKNQAEAFKLQSFLMKLQLASKDYSGAVSTANAILAKMPGQPKAVNVKAQALYKSGQYAEAMKIYQSKLAKGNASQASLYQFQIAMCLKKMGNSEKAKEAFKAIKKGIYRAAAKEELKTLK